jgi:hypothetical protein
MKSGDAYRFSLSWPVSTEEQILAGEFLNKLGNKKSRFIVQLVCDYLSVHPEAMNAKETIKFIISNTSSEKLLTDMIKSIIQEELAGKTIMPSPDSGVGEETAPTEDTGIDAMLFNLEAWNT